ncbi:MAG: hypothetical protein AAFU64_19385, partial [Bacteroidota bacterium]
DDQEFESSLRKKLEGIESTPPPDAFANILAQSQGAARKRGGLLPWLRFFAWLFILLGTPFLLLQDQMVEPESDRPVSNQKEGNQPDQTTSIALPKLLSPSDTSLPVQGNEPISGLKSPSTVEKIEKSRLDVPKALENTLPSRPRVSNNQVKKLDGALLPAIQPRRNLVAVDPETDHIDLNSSLPNSDNSFKNHILGDQPAEKKVLEETSPDGNQPQSRPQLSWLSLEHQTFKLSLLKAPRRGEIFPESREIAPYVPPRPMYLSFYFSPLYTYKRVIPNQEDQRLVTGLNTPGSQLKDRSGYGLGVDWELMLSKRLGVYAGLNFEKIKTNISYTFREQDTTTFEFSGQSATSFRVTPTFR